MKKRIVLAAAGMVVLGLLISGCEQKKAEQQPAPEQKPVAEKAPVPAPAKKAPQGC